MSKLDVSGRLRSLRAATIGYRRGQEPASQRFLTDALQVVRSRPGDPAALEAFAEMVVEDRFAAGEVRTQLSRGPQSYESDRARRLLDAALSGSPPAPPDPSNAALFEAEEALGRRPLREAFAQLSAREPGLERLRARTAESCAQLLQASHRSGRSTAERAAFHRLRSRAMTEVAALVGPRSQHSDPLLHSYIARNVAYRALDIAAGAAALDPDASYFDSQPES
jgi:hypothetical protein